ncbi:formylglycine-generating enzyme family protein [Rubrolithibacter danxiaensis]|uniref:formylglycine-generating enzyme family protein n=1 Tax=Rubrolithibacter danxiaensis TaxID=3390805 RepID=UPI003BF800B1
MESKKRSFGLFLLLSVIAISSLSGFTGGKKTAATPAGMVKIPAGVYTPFFQNKSDKPVSVESFYLDSRAVTNAEFLEFVKANPKWAKSNISPLFADKGYLKHWEGDFNIGKQYNQIKNSPVTNVSWFAANAYCKWKGKRLPTLEEWEYAGSARITNDNRPIKEIILAWYSKPTPSVLPPVGSAFKNRFNLYDMHGLVWEWVSDFNSIVMEGDSRSNSAINRELFCASGSFGAADKENYAAFMRFAFRGSLKAKYTVNNLGFRCAKDIK